MEIYVASAFSKDNTGGNKAGVVVRDSHLTDEQKIKIARQLGYSETAFISASRNADFRFEYYTPVEEVPMCGHATIAAFVVLKHLGMLSKPEYKIETKSGILTINIDDDVIRCSKTRHPILISSQAVKLPNASMTAFYRKIIPSKLFPPH